MKKIIYICLAGIGVLTLVGCGNKKTLECTKTTETSDYGTQQEIYKVTFKDDKMIEHVVTNKMVLSAAMSQYKDDFFASVKLGMDEANDKNGINADATLKDNTIETKTSITIKDMDVEAKNYAGIDETQNFDSLKKILADNGYTCK